MKAFFFRPAFQRPYTFEIRCYLLLYHKFNLSLAKASRLWNTNTSRQTLCHGQDPTVFCVDNIKTKEFPDLVFKPLSESQIQEIHASLDAMDWVKNENAPGLGLWKMAHLVNQGQVTGNFGYLPVDVRKMLEKVPRGRLFNAALSLLEIKTSGGGTLIKSHTGISNVKWRTHIPVFVTPELKKKLCLEVNGKSTTWSKAFTMDDSFEHSVILRNAQRERLYGCRLVLILDTWNESLTVAERNEISFVTQQIL